MKITHVLGAAVLGATLLATAQTASADRYYRGGWHGGYRYGYVAPRGYARPYVAPSYAYVAPSYTYDPYYVASSYGYGYGYGYVAPRVVVRPRPLIVHRHWWRRW